MPIKRTKKPDVVPDMSNIPPSPLTQAWNGGGFDQRTRNALRGIVDVTPGEDGSVTIEAAHDVIADLTGIRIEEPWNVQELEPDDIVTLDISMRDPKWRGFGRVLWVRRNTSGRPEAMVKWPDEDQELFVGSKINTLVVTERKLPIEAVEPDKVLTIRRDILDTAADLIDGDRARTYGDVTSSFERIGRIWAATLGIDPIPPATVALMMAGLKISRATTSPDHADNWVDIAGYAALGGEIAQVESA